MEFKKCVRCGSFFISDNNVCCNCESKDRLDMSKLNGFIDNDITYSSIEDISINTGISTNNINRFIKENNIDGLNINL